MKIAILDLQQIMIANLMVGLSKAPKGTVMLDEGILRHMILSQLLNIRTKHKEYEFVIAGDSQNSWRRDKFPYYKYSRKKAREDLGIDWNLVIESLEKIRQELHDFFPYRVIAVPRAEADDVIGVLAARFGAEPNDWLSPKDEVLILSGDQDFIQLQKFPNIKQYDPIRKKELRTDDPDKFLFEHICAGDSGDGIPNILSPSDTYVTKTRQKPVRQKAMDAWYRMVKKQSTPEDEKYIKTFKTMDVLCNFGRNCKLIDLNCTPKDIKDLINKSFDEQGGKNKKQLMNYMIHNRLRTLTESLSEF